MATGSIGGRDSGGVKPPSSPRGKTHRRSDDTTTLIGITGQRAEHVIKDSKLAEQNKTQRNRTAKQIATLAAARIAETPPLPTQPAVISTSRNVVQNKIPLAQRVEKITIFPTKKPSKEAQTALKVLDFRRLSQKAQLEALHKLPHEKQLNILKQLPQNECSSIFKQLPIDLFYHLFNEFTPNERIAIAKELSSNFFKEVIRKSSQEERKILLGAASIPIKIRTESFKNLEAHERRELFLNFSKEIQTQFIPLSQKECCLILKQFDQEKLTPILNALKPEDRTLLLHQLRLDKLLDTLLGQTPIFREGALSGLPKPELQEIMEWTSTQQKIDLLDGLSPSAQAQFISNLPLEADLLIKALPITSEKKIELKTLLIAHEEKIIAKTEKILTHLALDGKQLSETVQEAPSQLDLIPNWKKNIEKGIKKTLLTLLTQFNTTEISKFLENNDAKNAFLTFIKTNYSPKKLVLTQKHFGLPEQLFKAAFEKFIKTKNTAELYSCFSRYLNKLYLEIEAHIGILNQYGVFASPTCPPETRKLYNTLLESAVSTIKNFYSSYKDWIPNLPDKEVRNEIAALGNRASFLQNQIMLPSST